MERLTFDDNGCNSIKDCENDLCRETCVKVNGCSDCPIKNAIDKLSEYEDLEEKGLLLKLPCKIGDKVYCIMGSYKGTNPKIFSLSFDYSMIPMIGKYVFLTKEKAEKAMTA